MRISQYLEINKKLKTLRQSAGISQKEMAAKLDLSIPSYSNYENGYSEAPMEIIEKFCSIIGITLDNFFGFNTPSNSNEKSAGTYSDFLLSLDKIKANGIPVEITVEANKKTHTLTSLISIESPQIASLLNGWKELNEKLEKDYIDSDEYNIWFEDLLHSFKIPISKY